MTALPADTIGYFAIILPDEDEFSGAFLTEQEQDAAKVNLMMMTAMMGGANPYGALAATMVEGATTGRPDVLAMAARAYSAVTKHRFFYVIAHRDSGGVRTDTRPFEAQTIEGAREELNNLPEVMEIKGRIMARNAGRVPN